MKIAVQLYSIRDGINNGEDMLEALGKVKEIGYDGVEFAGYFGLDADVLKARLDELGLVCVGTHTGIGSFEEQNIEETLDFHDRLGTPLIGVGGAPHSKPDELARTCEIFEKGNAIAEKRGMKLYYHNHSDEFMPMENGVKPITLLAQAAWLEIDTYWSHHAGEDNATLIPALKDKTIHIHLKDGLNGIPRALGEGDNDIPKIVKAAKEIGLEWLIVENDDPVPTGLDDITRSLKYLKTII